MNEINIVGYIVVIKAKKGRAYVEQYEVLGYGEDRDPSPDTLLRDRGASIFDTREQALKEIRDTKALREDGNAWIDNWEFGIITAHKRPNQDVDTAMKQ